MIRLSTAVSCDVRCPHCAGGLEPGDWLMPGMRSLVRTRCASCSRGYFADLATGQALYSPMVLEIESGIVHDPSGVPWFAQWLSDSYRARSSRPVGFRRVSHRPVARPVVLLNCIDTLYGHALLKLLNAQRDLDRGDVDVVLLVQPFLEWLVPDGVAECWVVDLPLREGTAWNDGVAEEIRRQCERFPELYLAPAHSHPAPSTFAIERFSRVPPFDLQRWGSSAPTVTFVWRDDRVWPPEVARSAGERAIRRIVSGRENASVRRQRDHVIRFFAALRDLIPDVDAAVAGLGASSGFPEWIHDLRLQTPNADDERAWCRRYAASHAVVGVHGSNMLLPSGHAGSAIEIVGDDRTGNFLQDLVLNEDDVRGALFRYRFVTPEISPDSLAPLIAFVIRRYPDFQKLMEHDAESNVRD